MKRFSRYAVLVLLLGLLLWQGSLNSPSVRAKCLPTNYVTFGYDMQRTSYNPEECIISPYGPPTLAWGNSYTSSNLASREGISVYKDIAFIGLGSKMLAFDAYNGALQWSFGTGAPISGAATVHEGRVFFGSQDMGLYAIDPGSGGLLWGNSVGVPITTTPVGFEKFVIVSMEDGAVYAFRIDTGILAWQTPPLGKNLSSPSLLDKTIYVSALVANGLPNKSVVYAIDASSGTVLWSTPGIPGNISAPALVDHGTVITPTRTSKRIYVSSDYAKQSVHSFSALNGAAIWASNTNNEPVYGKPAVDNKQVYVVSASSGQLFALNAYNGSVNWNASSPNGPLYKGSSPTVINELVFAGGDYHLDAFTPGGSHAWSQRVKGLVDSPPTVVNGWLYITALYHDISPPIHSIFAYKA